MGDITPFAESLLSQQRERNEQERKRRERRENKAFFGKIGLGIAKRVGNELLAQQTQDFMNKTEFKSARQIARQADNVVSRMQKELDEIRASEQDPIQFLIQQATPLVENELASTTPYKERGTADYTGTIYKGAKEIAEERWRILTEAEKIWQDENISAEEEKIRLIAQDYRPDTITDLITAKLSSFVSGRDGQDADVREMLSLEDYINDQDEGSRGYWIRYLQNLNDEFNRSGDLNKAGKVARSLMANSGNPQEETKELVNTELVKADDNTFFRKRVTTTYKINKDGSLDANSKQVTEELVRGDDGTPEIVDMRSEADRVRAAMEMFNYESFIDKNFTADAKREFFSAMIDAGSNELGAIDTFEEYQAFSKSFYELATGSGNYVLDSEGEEFFKQGLAEWHKKDGERLQARISVLEAEGKDTTQAQNAYMTALANISKELRQNASQLSAPFKPENVETTTTLTPAEKLEKYQAGESIYVDQAMVNAYPSLKEMLGATIKLGVSNP